MLTPADVHRPAFSITTSGPGSDLAGETAAALASSAIWFRMRGEADYADQCLSHARTLFKFADEYRGKYTDTIPAGGLSTSHGAATMTRSSGPPPGLPR